MYWQEEESSDREAVSTANCVDLRFKIEATPLPVDHGWLLYRAILQHLPWIEEDPTFRIHPILHSACGNGWEAPQQRDALLFPSRRTPLILRVDQGRLESASALEGVTLKLQSATLRVGSAQVKPLQPSTTLYAHHLACSAEEGEEGLLQRAEAALQREGIPCKKMLCGKAHQIGNGQDQVTTRSLLISSLSHAHSIRLQQCGLGRYGHLGCGLFVPHKAV